MPASPLNASSGAVIEFKVADMACGHCVATITKAITAAMPGASVDADPGTKLVRVTGAADRKSLEALISEAGYSPAEA